MRVTARLAAPLLAGLLLACSAQGSSAPNPTTILREAGQAMARLHSTAADVTFGSGVQLQGLTLTSATSKIQLPGESDTTFKVKQGDFLVDLRVVTASGHVYLRLPFSSFTELSQQQASEVPDLARLFDSRAGLPALLPAGEGATYVGSAQVAGTDTDEVSATYTAAQVGSLLGTVKPAGNVHTTIWAGQSDHLVRRVILKGPLLTAGKNVQVQVDLHDFNRPVAIAVPV